MGEWVGGLDQGLEGWGGVMSVWVVSLDSLCRWQVQVSVYCSWRIPAHLRCTQCSIQCLQQISPIQTRLYNVVGPVLVVVCHDQVRRQVSQCFRCRDS